MAKHANASGARSENGQQPDPTENGLFQLLAENSDDGILIADFEGAVVFANGPLLRLFGCEREQVIGRPLAAVIPGLQPGPPAAELRVQVPGVRCSGEGVDLDIALQQAVVQERRYYLCQVRPLLRPQAGAERLREVLARYGQRLAEARTPREVAAATLDAADELFGWDCCFIDLIADEDGRLHSILGMDLMNGQRQEIIPAYKRLVPGSFSEKTLVEGAHLVLREAPSDDASSEIFPFGSGRPSASLMFVPIRKDAENVGVLSIQSYTPRAYSGTDLDLLQALADYSGGAFRRALAEEKVERAEQELLASRERFSLVTRATNDAVYDWDISSGHIWWNECMETLFGHTEASRNRDIGWWTEQIHPEDRDRAANGLERVISSGGEFWSAEYRFRRGDGSYAYVFDRGFIVYSHGHALRMLGSMMDISARKAAEQELRHGAYHDLLTGLPNRTAFIEELNRAVAHAARRDGYRFAVLFLDLDRFKVVNDSLGHAAGDELLVAVSQRLLQCIRPGDMVARLGGDEFVLLLDDLQDERDATCVAERIGDELTQPFQTGGREAFTGTSIGIAFSASGQKSAEDLLRDADTAMYRAKAGGRGRYDIFDAEMRDRVVSALQMETDLRRALERDQFQLHYQPIVELATGTAIGFEALLRWEHPVRGLVLPGEFIPLAEETGLIVPIGWWALRKACNTLAHWQSSDPSLADLSISVNLSARQLSESDVVEQVRIALEQSGIPAKCLKLELTETAVMQNAMQAAEALTRLRNINVQLHIDDFGTGQSSLQYLHRLPIHALKIDQGFIRDLPASQESRAICSTILALAQTVGVDAIAEGLESAEQIEELIQIGCRYGQGFYFSPPIGAFAARRYLEALDV